MFVAGPVPTAARGTRNRVVKLPDGNVGPFYGGLVKIAAPGTSGCVARPPEVVTWVFFRGHERTATHGGNKRHAPLPVTADARFSSGPLGMVALQTKTRVP